MIQSMTGYGSAEYHDKMYSVHLEIKGHNHRYLDIKLSLPTGFASCEEDIRFLVRKHCTRGRLEIRFDLLRRDAFGASIDLPRARALKEALTTLKRDLGLADEVTMSHLLEFKDAISSETDPEILRPLLLKTCTSGLEDFVKSRCREGKETVTDIMSQLDRFTAGLGNVKKQLPGIEIYIKERLRSRFEEVLGDRINEERILGEIAVFLVKHSVNEEVNRLETYTGQFTREMESGGVVGKRLDFICQEMNREVNTIASKNITDEIPVRIIEMKDALENIREQLRNIE